MNTPHHKAVNMAKLQLVTHEGLRLKPYRCTAGKLTIGYGRNLEDVGITEAEANMMLDRDTIVAMHGARGAVGNVFESLSDVRKAVLINMAFNLGPQGLGKFKGMIAALENRDYVKAAAEMLDSKWAKQVGKRARDLAEQMRTGV